VTKNLINLTKVGHIDPKSTAKTLISVSNTNA